MTQETREYDYIEKVIDSVPIKPIYLVGEVAAPLSKILGSSYEAARQMIYRSIADGDIVPRKYFSVYRIERSDLVKILRGKPEATT